LPQFFKVMRERGCRDVQLLLHLAGDHSSRVGRKQKAKNSQTRLGAESGKAVRGAGDENRIRSSHISIIAEIQKQVNLNLFFYKSFLLPERLSGYWHPMKVGLPSGSGNWPGLAPQFLPHFVW
jgi:hypothetical protein